MKNQLLCLGLFTTLFISFAAHSQDSEYNLERKPVWEAGIAVGYLSSFDYPGSRDPNTARFAAPFFIYRSEVFRFGDGGVGAVAIEEPRYKVDVSIGGALNAESESDSVRNGMPDLDLLFELGPRIQVRLYEKQWSEESRSRLDFDSKIRAVVSTDFKGIKASGFVFSSGLAYRHRAIAGDKIDLVVNTDITFGDQRYNDNFYTVSPEFETAQRPAYQARAGYVESRMFIGIALRPTQKLRIFTGVFFFTFANSANDTSPLFETDTSTQYAIGLAWSPLRSKKFIDVFATE